MWCNKYINIPFLDRGRTLDGADCWGLVRLIYAKELDIELPSLTDGYSDTMDAQGAKETVQNERQKWVSVAAGKEREFDVVLIRMNGVPMHVGVVTKRGFMIHSSAGVGVSHESYNNTRWKERVIGFERYAR